MNGLTWAQRLTGTESTLSAPARSVGVSLAIHSRGRHAVSEASSSRIAGWTGLSKATVCRALNELVDAGWLVRMRQTSPTTGAARASRYALLSPVEGDQDHPQRASTASALPSSAKDGRSPVAAEAVDARSQVGDKSCGQPAPLSQGETGAVSGWDTTPVSQRDTSKVKGSSKGMDFTAQVYALADRFAL